MGISINAYKSNIWIKEGSKYIKCYKFYFMDSQTDNYKIYFSRFFFLQSVIMQADPVHQMGFVNQALGHLQGTTHVEVKKAAKNLYGRATKRIKGW